MNNFEGRKYIMRDGLHFPCFECLQKNCLRKQSDRGTSNGCFVDMIICRKGVSICINRKKLSLIQITLFSSGLIFLHT